MYVTLYIAWLLNISAWSLLIGTFLGQFSVWRYFHRKYNIPWDVSITKWVIELEEERNELKAELEENRPYRE